MTSTYTGIGTRYVGNKNQVERNGECSWCHETTLIRAYDTRSWFVVFDVRILPLQKLRILDECTLCMRHRKVEYWEWALVQKAARSKARKIVKARPDDAATAIVAHRTLIDVDLTKDADALAEVMASQFEGSAAVHVYLADIAMQRGRPTDAHAGYVRAYRIDPLNSAAREGLAFSELSRGNSDRAQELMNPGTAGRAARNPAAHGAPAETALRAIPPPVPDVDSTQAASALPVKELREWNNGLARKRTPLDIARPLILGALVLLLAVIGFVTADRVSSSHQTLHIIDSIGGHLDVDIPGMGSVGFDGAGRQTLSASEGTFTAHVKGAVERDVQFTISCSRWPCFLAHDVFVLDASGGSVVSLRTALYTPKGDSKAPRRRYQPLHDFARFDRIDYAFELEPKEVLLGKEGSTTREVIELPKDQIESVVFAMIESGKARDAFDVAQAHLKLEPARTWMLYSFVSAAQRAHLERNAETFLEPRLQARPVDIDAHHAWIRLLSRPGGWRTAAQRYDELMESEPDETAWPYLRGLVSASSSLNVELFGRVVRDEKYACQTWMVLANSEASSGNWQGALEAARHAQECDDDDDGEATSFVYEALAALGRTEELDVALDRALAQYACDWEALSWRAEELAQGKSARDAADALKPLLRTAAKEDPKQVAALEKELARAQAWARGDFDAVVKQAAALPISSSKVELMSALAERGSMHELASWTERPEGLAVDAYTALGLALACRAHGDVKQARQWERIARPKLPAFGAGSEAAFLLEGRRVGVAEKALDLDLPAHDKAIVLALLSCSDEAARSVLLEHASKLLPRPVFPHATIVELMSKAARR